MPGIFAIIGDEKKALPKLVGELAELIESRGRNSSGLLLKKDDSFKVYKSESGITKLVKRKFSSSSLVVGYSGLNMESPKEAMPIESDGYVLFHDGIITDIPTDYSVARVTTNSNSKYLLDRIIERAALGEAMATSIEQCLKELSGTINGVLISIKDGCVYLFSNHGSLYFVERDNHLVVGSEIVIAKPDEKPLQIVGVKTIKGIFEAEVFKYQEDSFVSRGTELKTRNNDLSVLQYKMHSLKRCSKCILPETMPFIEFDGNGVCNYCRNYKKRKPKNKQDLLSLIEPYRRKVGYECIVPFSGGRDSCYGLYLIMKELKLKPVTYTYDWGMVTDIGRRNISHICGKLGVENIIVAGDIEKKRRNIKKNFSAWLKNPSLGMLNILTAGDKHFFRYVNQVKEKTGVELNLWGVNPLEVTHFKTGFLGIPPDFIDQKVYAIGKWGQLEYHSKRFAEMLKSPSYFNSSLWDTYSGEYYRSFAKKSDFYHIFDYWPWSETDVNAFLDEYGWEHATDSPSTWRIGDGTAGIYNYIYYTVAGFTEHDTFRSNQIREGMVTRDEALRFVEAENAPCFNNLQWYLASIGFDFERTISAINKIEKCHEGLY